jgi:Protein of unknown function (DUF2442)
MLRVTDAEPLDGYRMRVSFNDGVVREVDCSFLLRGTRGEPLRDPDYLRRRVDEQARTVVWPNGSTQLRSCYTAITSHQARAVRTQSARA